MKHVVLGTAGHIDHGKTALVKALTGIDTDRLKEEKERGITIDIGFAHLDLPSGIGVGIVDVPGHERFVRNMLAGAHGIDMVLLVIAADEGIMPQTREHLDIVSLLGVSQGLTAITKKDLVEEEWLNLVIEEVRDFLGGTFLEKRAILPVSSVSGEGLKELVAALDQVAGEVPGRCSTGLFRLPIDRVFTMKGFGTVVTGTLISGQVKVGDTVQVLPGGLEAKVRGLQVHNESVSLASAGLRTAVNLQGVDRQALERGDTLAHPGIFTPSSLLEVHFHHLATSPRPLKRRAPVRLHLGTREVMAQVFPLEGEAFSPSEEGYAQLWLKEPVVASRGDRFVLRSYSPVVTIGGGEVLDPLAERRKRDRAKAQEELATLRAGHLEEVLELFAKRAGYGGVTPQLLAGRSGYYPETMAAALEKLVARARLVGLDKEAGRWVHEEVFQALCARVIELLKEYHASNPLKEGMPKEELKGHLPKGLDARLMAKVLEKLAGGGRIVLVKDFVRLAGHDQALKEETRELKEKLAAILLKAGLAPPLVSELGEATGASQQSIRDVINLMASEGLLVKVKENLYFHRQAVAELKQRVVEFLKSHREINPAQYKELTGQSRKFTVPLMEYFDRTHLTIRVGDLRRLREKNEKG